MEQQSLNPGCLRSILSRAIRPNDFKVYFFKNQQSEAREFLKEYFKKNSFPYTNGPLQWVFQRIILCGSTDH